METCDNLSLETFTGKSLGLKTLAMSSSQKEFALGLAVGCVVGAVVTYFARPAAPSVSGAPRVVASRELLPPGGLSIAEHVGLASTGDRSFSLACIKTDTPHVDPAHVSAFDEVITVTAGECHVVANGGAPLVARAGQSLLLPRGFAYVVTTPGPAEYLAICFPAFAPQLKTDVSK